MAKANASLRDAYFAYDSHALDASARDALHTDAAILSPLLGDFASLEVVIEGHLRRTRIDRVRLGLGDRRASRARQFLAELGVPEASEACYQRNRRAHLFVAPRLE